VSGVRGGAGESLNQNLLMGRRGDNWRGWDGPCGRLITDEAAPQNPQDDQVGRRGGDGAAGDDGDSDWVVLHCVGTGSTWHRPGVDDVRGRGHHYNLPQHIA